VTLKPSAESTGIPQLDQILGGMYIGDNVIWHDDAGNLATVFCLNLIQAAHARRMPVIYVSFDRSPKNLFDKLGSLSDSPTLTLLDCFTHGKGAAADIFLNFYTAQTAGRRKRMICVENPHQPEHFTNALYTAIDSAGGEVRLIFESLTGMQEVWGGEEHVIHFYSRACPRLYELNTIAYWLIEKGAHSLRLRSSINQIAQVVIDLAVKRGKTFMTIIKAERQGSGSLNRPFAYMAKGLEARFETQDRASGPYDLGDRLKLLRQQKGISQTKLARMIGVTASTISQIESNLIFPSLPALFRMAEIMSVDVAAFLEGASRKPRKVVFSHAEALPARLPASVKDDASALRLIQGITGPAAEPHLIELRPRCRLSAHFSAHKGPELGYVLSGSVTLTVDGTVHTAAAGDTIYLVREVPQQWENTGRESARILWVNIL
jgi:transcriptional regulator with XRE-family HTH domain/KaiC/GvpD/RAD55 family RecA-like ATPase